MKRDMDLLRDILMRVEEQPVNQPWPAQPLLGYSLEEVVYHVKLAMDASLVDGRIAPGDHHAMVLRLTNGGHEFLEAARSDTIWEKAKALALSTTGTLTLEALKLALAKVIAHMFKP